MNQHRVDDFFLGAGPILFLQGPPSAFWSELADAMARSGADVLKINTSPAEALFWRRKGALRFSGDLNAWRRYFERFIDNVGVSRVFLYADRAPHHRVAIEICEAAGVPVTVFENGYLRPDWITVEAGGMGRFSRFPKDPERIREIARRSAEPDLDIEFPHRFLDEAWREVAYHLANGATPAVLWRYEHRRYYHPFVDYAAWARRLAAEPLTDWFSRRCCRHVVKSKRPFYFVPLQLQSDYSISDCSSYGHISEMIDEVVASFAAHAPKDAILFFKAHPHDNGRERWGRRIRRAAARLGVQERMRFVTAGPFGRLLSASRGCVVVNSTSGVHAIREGKPVIALGDAVYDVPGLAHQRGLDAFWNDPEPVDRDLARDFVAALAARTQVKGSFFAPAGRAQACQEIVARLGGAQADLSSAPRLDRAAPTPSALVGAAAI